MAESGSCSPRGILEQLATAVVTLDATLRVSYMNPAAEELFGLSARQAVGHALSRLVLDASEPEAMARRVLAQQARLAGRDLDLLPRETPERPLAVDCSASVLPGASGEAAGVLMEFQDTTRLRRISREADLMTQHGISRTIVRQLAHEIKNPLGGLKGAAQLLAGELADSALTEYTDVMVREVDRLAQLIDRMLGPNRPVQRIPLDVHELLDHVLQLVSADAPASVELQRDFDLSLPPLALDRDLMVQVFLNLARNALQSMAGAGQLRVRTRVLSNYTLGARRHRQVASIEFQDDGPGVDASVADTLFYPLVTSRREGTGLGLPISQELVNRHQGLIEFSSRPGHTVFQVLLPLSGEPETDDE